MPANLSFSNESHSSAKYCIFVGANPFIYTTILICNIVILLPLFSFILYNGLQKWLQNHATSSASTISNLNCFTHHMVIMELVGVCRCVLSIIGVFTGDFNIFEIGSLVFTLTWYGQGFFHILTCVEHYLAVVHPLTYLNLRNDRGIRIRNISIGCAWLLSFLSMGLMTAQNYYFIFGLIILTFFFAVITFCCLSVLCVLIRPGPGERGRDNAKVDKSKQRAFYTIVAILGALVGKFSWALIWIAAVVTTRNFDCVMILSEFFINLPSTLMLPLLYLQRKRTFVCCKTGIQKGYS